MRISSCTKATGLQAALHNHTVGTVIVHGVFRISYSNRLLYKTNIAIFLSSASRIEICIFLKDSFHRGRSRPALFSIYILAYIFDIFNIFMLFTKIFFGDPKIHFRALQRRFSTKNTLFLHSSFFKAANTLKKHCAKAKKGQSKARQE